MDLVFHNANNQPIGQRAADGYVNATALCKAAGKRWNDYFRLDSTKEYLQALSEKLGIEVVSASVTGFPVTEAHNPATALIQVFQGGNSQQGTWIHPQVAIHLGMWLSSDFAVQVTEWVVSWMTTGQTPTQPISQPQQPQPEQPKKLAWKPLALYPQITEEVFKSLDPISQSYFAETPEERRLRVTVERTELNHWLNHCYKISRH